MNTIEKEFFKVFNFKDIRSDLSIKDFLIKKNISKLYHISKVPYRLDALKPFLPSARLDEGEDGSLKRISLSTSPLGCLNGINLIERLDNFNIKHDLNVELKNVKLYLYEIDIDLLNLDYLIAYPTLYTNNLVLDAINNEEFWYLENIDLSKVKSKLININEYHTTCPDDVLYTEVYNNIKNTPFNYIEDVLNNIYNNQDIFEVKIYGNMIAETIDYNESNLIINPQDYKVFLESCKYSTDGFYIPMLLK